MAAAPDKRDLAPDGARRAAQGADPRLNRLYANERPPLGPREAWRLLVRSWPFIAMHRRLLVLKCLFAFSSLTLFLLSPWPLKIVIDNVIDGRPLTGIPALILIPLAGRSRSALLTAVALFLATAAILVGMTGDEPQSLSTGIGSGGLDQAGFTANAASDGWSLWNGLFGYFETRVTLDLTQRINQAVRTAIYSRFLRSPLGLYSDQKVGDAVFRVMHDSAAIGAVIYTGVLAPALSVAAFALALVILWAEFPREPIIPVLAVLVLPAVAIGSGLFGRSLRSQGQRMRERGSDVMAAFEERIAHVQLIKAFGREDHESRQLGAASWGSYRATLRMLGIILLMTCVVVPAVGVLAGATLYYLMMQVIRGRMTLGDVMLLGTYTMMLMRPMTTIGQTWAALQGPIAGLRRIHSVLDNLAEPDRAADPDGALARISEIELRDVSLAYPGSPPVLEHVSLTLRPGQMVALAGPSGFGKTTLIYSIPRFIEPAAGEILINGIDSRSLALHAIRDRVGFVFQQEALFSVSIADNIRYGSADASDAEVREAARMAGAGAFISQLSDGYATMLGRRGTRLSVGQKQRIAIARALIAKPEVLILDEPAAPLDPAAEADLIGTLRDLARTRIVIIVAHRAETLAACDRIFFIHGGTVSAAGTHEQLLASCPPYQSYLAISQSEIEA